MSGGGDIGAVVIGGGLSGLAAAAYLAKSGVRTVLLEAGETFGGGTRNVSVAQMAEAAAGEDYVYALDHKLARDLDLERHGLRFAPHDMAVTALRTDGRHLFLPPDPFAAREHIAAYAPRDGSQWRAFR